MYYYDIKESGTRIKDLRKEKGFTQEKVSEQIGISCDGYKQIENGRNGAKIDTLILIAELFDTTLDYLVLGRKAIVVDKEE